MAVWGRDFTIRGHLVNIDQTTVADGAMVKSSDFV